MSSPEIGLGGVPVDLKKVMPESCLPEQRQRVTSILGEAALRALALLNEENICSATRHVTHL